MKILIKFPTKNRFEKVKKCVNQYIRLANDTSNIQFLFTLDIDDVTLRSDYDDLISEINQKCSAYYVYGNSSSKIDAINRDMDIISSRWDILLLASDDMIPISTNYDNIIIQDMKNNFPDTDGVLWYSDGFRNDIITLSVMGKKYYDRFGYIYHPSYKSFYCDNEFTDVVCNLNKVFKSQDVIIRHEHPDNMRTSYDMLYVKNSKFMNIDSETYRLRKLQNFPINKTK
jgi:hypothetical protein